MKIPSSCPCCNKNLINEDVPLYKFWKKSCLDSPNHKFMLLCNSDTDAVVSVMVSNRPNLYFKFVPNTKILVFNSFNQVSSIRNRSSMPIMTLPYFNPNLNDWNNLFLKLKKYLILV